MELTRATDGTTGPARGPQSRLVCERYASTASTAYEWGCEGVGYAAASAAELWWGVGGRCMDEGVL